MPLIETELIEMAEASARRGLDRGAPDSGFARTAMPFVSRVLRLPGALRFLVLGAPTLQLLFPESEAFKAVAAGPAPIMLPLGAGSGNQPARVLTSCGRLPFGGLSFDAAIEVRSSAALTLEANEECATVLREIARVLRPGARYLFGEPAAARRPVPSLRLSADKRRVDRWRGGAGGMIHHTLELAREDGSWRRLHERFRQRTFDEIEQLLGEAGFSVLNAFEDYAQTSQAPRPRGDSILLCRREPG